MLNPHYRYLSLDFETTGLDLQQDEPIQIGIVEFDDKGQIIWGYQSLLRPQKAEHKLKSIVSFITGLSIDSLLNAPYPSDIEEEIWTFFGETTIIIGHNIGFDLHFLKKFFPNLKWKGQIDTFKLSQTLVHYPPSYAQEVLIEQLKQKASFQTLLESLQLAWALNFHDAYCDAKLSFALFWHLAERIHMLFEHYPILKLFLRKTDDLIKHIFETKNYPEEQKLVDQQFVKQLPPLKRLSPPHTQVLSAAYPFDLHQLQAQKSYQVDTLGFKQLLWCIATQQRCILAFSHKAKLDIAKNILNDLGIKNLGFAKEEQTINPEAFKRFTEKSQFSLSEFLFLLKYFSHLEQWLGVLDLNSKEDYEIYTAIKDQRKPVEYPIILTTHGGLYALLEQGEKYADYRILFFDSAWRYKSFNLYLSRPYDINYTLNYLDMLVYKYRLELEYGRISKEKFWFLDAFYQFLTVFTGVLGQETKTFFTNTDATQITLNPILGNIAFYHTNKLLEKFTTHENPLKSILEEHEFLTVWSQIEHMIKIFGGMLCVEKKMYDRSGFYFIYAEEVKFSSREDFLKSFGKQAVYFLSIADRQLPALIPEATQHWSTWTQEAHSILHLSKIPSVLQGVTAFDREKFSNGCIFILSVKKEESKALFEAMITKGFDQNFLILVENITGGSWKNLFKTKQQGCKIIIGGYQFLLQLFAQKVAISQLIVYNSKGSQQDLIFSDILWYGRELLQ